MPDTIGKFFTKFLFIISRIRNIVRTKSNTIKYSQVPEINRH